MDHTLKQEDKYYLQNVLLNSEQKEEYTWVDLDLKYADKRIRRSISNY